MEQDAVGRCSQCGRPTTRSYEALEAAIAEYQVQGYSLESRGHDWAQLKRPDPERFFFGIWLLLVLGILIAQDPGRVVLWLDGDGQLKVNIPVPHRPASGYEDRPEEQTSLGRGVSALTLVVVIVLLIFAVYALVSWLAPGLLR